MVVFLILPNIFFLVSRTASTTLEVHEGNDSLNNIAVSPMEDNGSMETDESAKEEEGNFSM